MRLINYEARMQEIWDRTDGDLPKRVLELKKFIYNACKEEREDLYARLVEALGEEP